MLEKLKMMNESSVFWVFIEPTVCGDLPHLKHNSILLRNKGEFLVVCQTPAVLLPFVNRKTANVCFAFTEPVPGLLEVVAVGFVRSSTGALAAFLCCHQSVC